MTLSSGLEILFSDSEALLISVIFQNVDTENEEIFLYSSRSISASDLESLISKDRAGYHLFNYAHRFDGEDISSIGKRSSLK